MPRASRIQVHNANVSVMQKQENEHKSKGNPRLFVIRVFAILKGVGFFFMFLMSSSYQRVFEWGVKFILAVFWRMGVGCGLRLYFVPGVLKFFCQRFWEGCKV